MKIADNHVEMIEDLIYEEILGAFIYLLENKHLYGSVNIDFSSIREKVLALETPHNMYSMFAANTGMDIDVDSWYKDSLVSNLERLISADWFFNHDEKVIDSF